MTYTWVSLMMLLSSFKVLPVELEPELIADTGFEVGIIVGSILGSEVGF